MDKTQKRISVIIATYNRCESLKNTLETFLRQDSLGSLDYEIIVTDNNSDDKTKEVVESCLPRFAGRLKYLFESRQGKSFALNAALKEARGEILAFTDDDMILPENWLEEIVKAFHEHDCIGIGGKTLSQWISQPPQWFLDEEAFKTDGPFVFASFGEEVTEYGSKDKKAPPIGGGNMAFKRIAFEKYGDFRTDLGRKGDSIIGGEENDFLKRLQANNEKVLYIPSVIAYHRIGTEKLNKDYFKAWYYGSGRTAVIKIKDSFKKGVYYFGIPRWVIKELFQEFFSYTGALLFSWKHIFYHYLKVLSVLGEMREYRASYRRQ